MAYADALPARSATREPVARPRMAPAHGSYPSKTWCMIPVPRVSVRNWVRKPIRPRAGTTNSSLTQPVPWLVMDSIRPRRTEISEVTVPRYSSGT